MDPNANLLEQEDILVRSAVPVTARTFLHDDLRLAPVDRDRLRELRIALADWLAAGGFAPDWFQAPTAARYYGEH